MLQMCLLAEMLKAGGPILRSHLRQLYNDALSPNATPPTEWKRTTISVIFKSGDPQLPSNYRPIAIIPLLYKLFARLLYNRLETHLDNYQTPDQAGFRHDYSTEDHLFPQPFCTSVHRNGSYHFGCRPSTSKRPSTPLITTNCGKRYTTNRYHHSTYAFYNHFTRTKQPLSKQTN